MSASEAFHHHETPLMKDPVTLTLLADWRMCPSLSDVNTLYDKWLVEKKGPSNGCAMFVLSICTPLMSHVHETRQAGEMAFMNSSGSLDRYNNPVFFMCTYHPCGALPLGVWVTSNQSQPCLQNCLEKWKFMTGKSCFWWLKVPKKDLTFSWQMMTLARDKLLESTGNRQHSCFAFSTFCKQQY